MLRITIDELDELRLKLLCAVASGDIQGQAADAAYLLAKDLDGMVALLESEGVTSVCGCAHSIGNAMQRLIDQHESPNKR